MAPYIWMGLFWSWNGCKYGTNGVVSVKSTQIRLSMKPIQVMAIVLRVEMQSIDQAGRVTFASLTHWQAETRQRDWNMLEVAILSLLLGVALTLVLQFLWVKSKLGQMPSLPPPVKDQFPKVQMPQVSGLSLIVWSDSVRQLLPIVCCWRKIDFGVQKYVDCFNNSIVTGVLSASLLLFEFHLADNSSFLWSPSQNVGIDETA